jgi:hypothetical protein
MRYWFLFVHEISMIFDFYEFFFEFLRNVFFGLNFFFALEGCFFCPCCRDFVPAAGTKVALPCLDKVQARQKISGLCLAKQCQDKKKSVKLLLFFFNKRQKQKHKKPK